MYMTIVAIVVAAHFAFVGYLPAGGFLAWRWRPTIWLHGLAVLWALAIVMHLVECPLTFVERWARAAAGMAPLPTRGFIAYYIDGVFYPHGWATAAQIVVFALVVLSWLGWWQRRRSSDRALKT